MPLCNCWMSSFAFLLVDFLQTQPRAFSVLLFPMLTDHVISLFVLWTLTTKWIFFSSVMQFLPISFLLLYGRYYFIHWIINHVLKETLLLFLNPVQPSSQWSRTLAVSSVSSYMFVQCVTYWNFTLHSLFSFFLPFFFCC